MSLQQGAKALRARRISFNAPDGYTLKIGPINFYPTTGKITLDTAPRKYPERGLPALLHLLQARGLYRGEPKLPGADPKTGMTHCSLVRVPNATRRVGTTIAAKGAKTATSPHRF
jgi:hypothetical protein